MTRIGRAYGLALYSLASEESLSATILDELTVLDGCFRENPEFIRILSSPALSMQERCSILDDSFREKVNGYVLNFMKILTEKGYLKHFGSCREAYESRYNLDNGILPVTAVTAVAMTGGQITRLADKLHRITGKQIQLNNRIDPSILGGVRLDYDGKRLDDSLVHRLDAIRSLLKNAVL